MRSTLLFVYIDPVALFAFFPLAFVEEMIETVMIMYMADDEEAERTVDGAVRKEIISLQRHFFRIMDDRYVVADAATLAARDLLIGMEVVV